MNKENQIITFRNEKGQTKIDFKLNNDTIWLSQKQMATLFEKDSDTIGLHIKNIYKTNEL